MIRLTQKQGRDVLRSTVPGPKGQSKYRVKKTMVDNIFFTTESEAARYAELKLLERAGEITDLERQKSFPLAPSVRLTFRKKASPAMRYTADFVYRQQGKWIVEDVKPQGLPNEKLERDFVMRAHLMKSIHDLDVYVVRVGKNGKSVVTHIAEEAAA